MTSDLRKQVAGAATTVVIKIGSRVLSRADGSLNEEIIEGLAEEISLIRAEGRRVVLVSSGAVAAGAARLGLTERPRDLAKLQAVAAIGQTRLIEAYDRTFRARGLHTAQVLVTADDFDHRVRYLNVRNTLNSLLELGAIPIINENDTVAVDELMVSFGDNDRLAAMVTNLLQAPLLIVLSDVAGLFDRHPESDGAQLLSTVDVIEDVLHFADDQLAKMSKGGMASKLQAARSVTAAGENMIIADGHDPSVLRPLLAGETIGTLFPAQGKPVSPWKRWIGFSAQSRGQLYLDAGACAAIVKHGRSLLAIGITGAHGQFDKGDIVSLCNAAHTELARGLTNYSVHEVEQIKGQRSEHIASILGHRPYQEVVHRDNMAVL